MIISTRKIKILAVISAVIIIPFIGLNLINLSMNVKSRPVSNTVVEPDRSDITIPMNLQSQDEERINFFAEYRMERERVRGKETGLLREIANNSSSDKKARDTACLKLVELAEKAEKEMQAEAMIKSQGFQDCAVIITPKSTTVMIESTSTQIERKEEIRKAVSIATGCIEKNISIVKRQSVEP
ncbi:MAG: SpoIIIAH-like family protein [Syntrophomonas sp.]|nr:SpoIIIAH-like family protein [Syntrophomonas sp.]